jgi:hypothetical protein
MPSDAELLKRLNATLPGKESDLRAEHTFLTALLRGWNGQISWEVRKVALARHQLVRTAINAIEQSPPPPRNIGYAAALHTLSHLSRPARRAAEIERLEAALKKLETGEGEISMVEIDPRQDISKLIRYLLLDYDIQFNVYWLRDSLVRYKLEFLKNFGLIFPKERLEEIKGAHNNCTDPGQIAALNAEATALSLPTAENSTRAMRIAMQAAWEPVQDAIQHLATTSAELLERERELRDELLKDTYASHPVGLEYTPSVLVTAYDPWIARFRAILAPGNSHPMPQLSGPTPMEPDNTILNSIFGLDILPNE